MVCRHSRDRTAGWLVFLVFLVVGLSLYGEEGRSAKDFPPAPVAENSAAAPADANDTLCCQRLAALIEQQKALISRETGQLKRELAALRDDLTKPGMREILAGIGYIFGIAGVGIYLKARKSGGRRSGATFR
jgi:hypothetical protein